MKDGDKSFTILNTSHAMSFNLFTWRYSEPDNLKRPLCAEEYLL